MGQNFFAGAGEVDAVAFAHRHRFAAFVRQEGGVAAVGLGEEAVGVLVVLLCAFDFFGDELVEVGDFFAVFGRFHQRRPDPQGLGAARRRRLQDFADFAAVVGFPFGRAEVHIVFGVGGVRRVLRVVCAEQDDDEAHVRVFFELGGEVFRPVVVAGEAQAAARFAPVDAFDVVAGEQFALDVRRE